LVVRAKYGEVGDSPGQFSYPRCIESHNGSLWIIDKLARVQKIDARTGASLGGWRMPQWENGKPTGITLWTPPAGGKTRVFVADTHYHRVMIYDPDGVAHGPDMLRHHGTLLGSVGSYGENDGEFLYPTDVAILATPDGRGIARMYVSEYGGHDRINVFEPEPGQPPGDETRFRFVKSFGSFGQGSGNPIEFSRPQSIAIDQAKGELIIVDACNHRVGRATLDGELIAWIGGGIGKQAGRMQYPYGLWLLDDRSVMVAEFGGNRVQRFDLDTGQSLGVYGETGRGAGQLASPWGVAGSGDLVYVLDSGNNRVQAIDRPTGKRPVALADRAGERP